MPRRTHLPVGRGRSRAERRALTASVSRRRFRQAKLRYADDYSQTGYALHDPACESVVAFCELTGQSPRGRALFVHPELAADVPPEIVAPWPFSLGWRRFADNPFTRCSCWICRGRDLSRRARERRSWRREVDEQLAELADTE
jgi:hypothetical protein